jgi:hypothetical protein
MTIQLELWHVISLIVILISGFFTMSKLVMGAQLKQIEAGFAAQNHRLEKIEQASRDDATNWQRAERELLLLKAELPLNYVRRDDFVQAVGGISTRIDNFALRMERALDNQRNGGSV